MQRVYLTCLSLMLYGLCFGQLVLTPQYLDMPSTYNPAIIGLFSDESVQMGIYSSSDALNDPAVIFKLPYRNQDFSALKNLTLVENETSSTFQARNLIFVSYQKTIVLKNKSRLSLGGQIQNRNDKNCKISTPQTVGITVAIHKNISTDQYKQKHVSGGLQTSLIYNTIDQSEAQNFHNSRVFGNSYDDFLSQFKKISQSSSLNYNYSVLKHDRTHNNFSFSLRVEHRNTIDRVFVLSEETQTGISQLSSSFRTVISPRFSYSIQKISKSRKSQFEYHMLLGRESAFSIGYGRKFKKGNIFRLLASISGNEYSVDYGLKFSYETSEYNYQIFTGFNNYRSGAFVVQLSAGYRITQSGQPSLLRLN